MWFYIAVCESIVLRKVGVPAYAVQGKEAVLSCDYDLEGQDLYAVKWYKNGLEFYRYLARIFHWSNESYFTLMGALTLARTAKIFPKGHGACRVWTRTEC